MELESNTGLGRVELATFVIIIMRHSLAPIEHILAGLNYSPENIDAYLSDYSTYLPTLKLVCRIMMSELMIFSQMFDDFKGLMDILIEVLNKTFHVKRIFLSQIPIINDVQFTEDINLIGYSALSDKFFNTGFMSDLEPKAVIEISCKVDQIRRISIEMCLLCVIQRLIFSLS